MISGQAFSHEIPRAYQDPEISGQAIVFRDQTFQKQMKDSRLFTFERTEHFHHFKTRIAQAQVDNPMIWLIKKQVKTYFLRY